MLIHLGCALIQLPETLDYMYNRIKSHSNKSALSDESTHIDAPIAVYQKPPSKINVASSPNGRRISQQFPICGTNQQGNQNFCNMVNFILNAQDELTIRMDKIEEKVSS